MMNIFSAMLFLTLPLLGLAVNKAEIARRLQQTQQKKGPRSLRKHSTSYQQHRRTGGKGSGKKESSTTKNDNNGPTSGAAANDASNCQFLEVAFKASDFDNPERAFMEGNNEGGPHSFGGFGIPIYDSITMQQVGTLQEFYNWVPTADCQYNGAWTFDGGNEKYGYGQMFYQGTCKGDQSGISGGTFDYACASGFDFMYANNDGTGIVYWHIYNCGGCARTSPSVTSERDV